MPRDSNGNYQLPLPNVVTGTPIQADAWANPTLQDLANEIQDSLSRTGQGAMQAPFQNADGSVTTPGVTFGNEPTMGLYRAGNGDMRIAIAGVDIARWDSGGLSLWNGTDWDRVSAGGANYYGRLDTDTALANNVDYATIPNVQPGIYRVHGWARLRRSLQTGYDPTINLSIGDAVLNPWTTGTEGQKSVRAYQFVDQVFPGETFSSTVNVSTNYANIFAADPAVSFLPDSGSTTNDFIYCDGVADVTSAGSVSWRAKFGDGFNGWSEIETGSYITLTKVG